MPKIVTLLSLMFILSTPNSFAGEPVIHCTGGSSFDKVAIVGLDITSKQIKLKYTVDSGPVLQKNYITVEFMKKNEGTTDLKKPIYLIGGNQSGKADDFQDDIALPGYGLYKAGLGSEISFDHLSNRVIGTVTCRQK